MRLKITASVLFAVALLTACTRAPVSQEVPSTPAADSVAPASAPDSRSYFKRQIDLLDSVSLAGYFDRQGDMLDSVNKNIYRALEGLTKDDAYQHASLGEKDGISYLLSDDQRLCLVSWDTRLGGTMIDFETVAIYKTAAGTKIRYLGEVDPETSGHTSSQTYFTKLYALTDIDSVTTYYAYGVGQASTLLPWRTLQAFRVGEDLDDTLPTFDDRENSFSYDLSKFDDNDDIADVIFAANPRDIQVPDIEDEVSTGQYTRYRFADGMYRRVE
ncbi:hypothetical protein [Dawidia soli]|uniref:Lipoprotein n=1 Tax=Dawidia soli TaxID=2782352 RepID=A0AAP2DA23_9BACT|nr:hypothetical protein [Dawidia soli]MBT1687722.1 hypothetical protein [Dawidia soli]